jgi:3-deoxy-7-phosphoheptulonate synthase
MILTLHRDASLAAVQAELQALGQWTRLLQGGKDGLRVLQILPHSAKISAARLQDIAGVAELLSAPSPHPLVDAQAASTWTLRGRTFGEGQRPLLFAGPCSVESQTQIERAAEEVAKAGADFLRGGAFKPRTSPYSFQGQGREALAWMRQAADKQGLGVVTEVMSELEVGSVAELADLVQLGSRNMQNFSLLRAVGQTKKPVLLKRGMSSQVEDWLLAGEYLLSAGSPLVIFCERGIQSIDPHTRNLLDLGAVALLSHVYRQPVMVDPSHATGRRDLIPALSKASLAAGAAGLMVEFHPSPASARSDGPQALDTQGLSQIQQLLGQP